jgi:hypothetical protein
MSRRNLISGLTLASALVLLLPGCGQSMGPGKTQAPPASVQAVPADVAAPESSAEDKGDAGPALASMTLAQAPQKMGVPVDLSYHFEGDVKTGQQVTLHLAAVPRVAGSNLAIRIKEDPRIRTTGRDLGARKASASTAYRQQVSVTKLASGPTELQVLVTMEVPEGSAHSWFNIPFDGTPTVSKQRSTKLE